MLGPLGPLLKHVIPLDVTLQNLVQRVAVVLYGFRYLVESVIFVALGDVFLSQEVSEVAVEEAFRYVGCCLIGFREFILEIPDAYPSENVLYLVDYSLEEVSVRFRLDGFTVDEVSRDQLSHRLELQSPEVAVVQGVVLVEEFPENVTDNFHGHSVTQPVDEGIVGA